MDINTINCRKNSQMIKSFFAPLVDCESNLVAIEFYFYFFSLSILVSCRVDLNWMGNI
jgi:hypothetical protein